MDYDNKVIKYHFIARFQDEPCYVHIHMRIIRNHSVQKALRFLPSYLKNTLLLSADMISKHDYIRPVLRKTSSSRIIFCKDSVQNSFGKSSFSITALTLLKCSICFLRAISDSFSMFFFWLCDMTSCFCDTTIFSPCRRLISAWMIFSRTLIRRRWFLCSFSSEYLSSISSSFAMGFFS